MVNHGIKITNLFTEPLFTEDILLHFFPQKKVGRKALLESHYTFITGVK